MLLGSGRTGHDIECGDGGEVVGGGGVDGWGIALDIESPVPYMVNPGFIRNEF